MDVLADIMEERRAAVQDDRLIVPASALLPLAKRRKHHSLLDQLRLTHGTAIISEVKKASPSAGLLRESYAPEVIARSYSAAGAIGISVLTEPRHFLGSGAHLRAVREAVDVPVLRKDFICDTYQILEAAAWGADVILLIAAALDDTTLTSLYTYAISLGLDVLAEVHNQEELDRVLLLEHAIVGVNSRNLKTLKTDLSTAHNLATSIPKDRLSIAESGIRTRDEIVALEAAGYDGFLIGESLLRQPDPALALQRLL
jgi:indole-3-glycerol phosphate synthase